MDSRLRGSAVGLIQLSRGVATSDKGRRFSENGLRSMKGRLPLLLFIAAAFLTLSLLTERGYQNVKAEMSGRTVGILEDRLLNE